MHYGGVPTACFGKDKIRSEREKQTSMVYSTLQSSTAECNRRRTTRALVRSCRQFSTQISVLSTLCESTLSKGCLQFCVLLYIARACRVRGASARNPLIGGPAGPRCRWKLANRRPLHDGELSCPSCSRPRFPSSLRRRALAGPPTGWFSRQAPTW